MGIEKIISGLLGFDAELTPKSDAVSRLQQMLIPGSYVLRYYGLAKSRYPGESRTVRRAIIASLPQEVVRIIAYGTIIYGIAFFPL